MPKIEGIRIKNFRGLKDISLGKTSEKLDTEPLTPITVVIGKNGVGKSTLFDVFGFLSDALKLGVQDACDLRGGFEKICSQGCEESIEFNIFYKQNDNLTLIYDLTINTDNTGQLFIEIEDLSYKINEVTFVSLTLRKGVGLVSVSPIKIENIIGLFTLMLREIENTENGISPLDITNKIVLETEMKEVEAVAFSDKRKLGIATLGALKQHPQISAFREFMEGWYLSYFTPDAARTLPQAGMQQHLNRKGDNLANVVQFMEREHSEKFQNILNRIAEKIPNIGEIKTYRDPISNQLHLLFKDKGLNKDFFAPQMSDGTLKVFAYLLLLEDPSPPPFICIEEPENGLYHKLLEVLAAEFRSHATGEKNSSQMFITTHQPYFVDALNPDEVWILEKGEDGFSKITRASDNELVKNMVEEGLPLGGLWYSDYLDAR